MKAAGIMTRRVVSIGTEASVLEAIRLMLQRKISGLPVVDGEGLIVDWKGKLAAEMAAQTAPVLTALLRECAPKVPRVPLDGPETPETPETSDTKTL